MDKNYIKSGTDSSIQLIVVMSVIYGRECKIEIILKCINKYMKTGNDHCFHVSYIPVEGENTDSI